MFPHTVDQQVEVNTYSTPISGDGQIVLPKPIRAQFGDEKDSVTLVQIGDFVFIATKKPRIPEIVAQMEKQREDAGISLDELLAGAAEERLCLWQERYATLD
ncbi:MAG: AbrB/MazE/SpoVT family DNA-binding domain-containing protein [Sphaerospermopsis sp. SIO1G2]|nr:AbrB/MazE/SpoVT family DNA-binding domain-containing protein [Sphaerospermopsis sp. SIO1G2]